MTRYIWSGIILIFSVAVPFVVFLLFPLYYFFHFSDVVIFAAIAGLLYISIHMMLPENILRTSEEIFLRSLIEKHGKFTPTILKASEMMQRYFVLQNRMSSAKFSPVIQAKVDEVDRLFSDVISSIEQNPKNHRVFLTLATRSIVAVEAIEHHAQLLASKNVKEDAILESREKISNTLDDLQNAIQNVFDRLNQAQLEKVDIASSVAETVLSRVKG